MINGLYYKNLILDRVRASNDLPAIIDGRIEVCTHECENCQLNNPTSCTVSFINWLYEDTNNLKIFTDSEQHFISFLSSGYIMRTEVETFFLNDKVFPYGRDYKDSDIICISEEFGLFFKALTPYIHYSIDELKEIING